MNRCYRIQIHNLNWCYSFQIVQIKFSLNRYKLNLQGFPGRWNIGLTTISNQTFIDVIDFDISLLSIAAHNSFRNFFSARQWLSFVFSGCETHDMRDSALDLHSERGDI